MKTEKSVIIDGIPCKIIKRSGRKRITLLIDLNGECEVRAPIRCKEEQIIRFVRLNKAWIENAKEEKKSKLNYTVSEEKSRELKATAQKTVPPKIAYYCERMGIEPPKKIMITSAKKRWGSCSSERHICISLYLMLYPEEAIDYVIVHEIAHLKEMNHSKKFWSIVKKELPDYQKRREMLK